jgi:hypothetical protein
MSEIEQKTDVKTAEPDKIADLTKQIEALRSEKTADSGRARELESKINLLTGQLSVLAAAANEPAQAEPAPDPVSEPEKAFEYHFQRRTKPIIDQALAREVAREKEMIALKHPNDWKEFGAEVEQLAASVSKEVLAQPGSYEQLLTLVKGKHADEIASKRAAEEVAKFQADAAKAAAGSPESRSVAVAAAGGTKPEEIPEEARLIAKKLGISEKDWSEMSAATTFDGIRYRGEVVH